jgi:hypothetical protein
MGRRSGAQQFLGHGADHVQVSSTSNCGRAASACATCCLVADPPGSTPTATAIVAGTRLGSDTDQKSTTHTPSLKRGRSRRATAIARRVLPIPPAPVRVTRRWFAARSSTSRNSLSLPISSESGPGRFVGGTRAGGRGAALPSQSPLARRAASSRISPTN